MNQDKEPNYILKTNEAVLMPTKQSEKFKFVRIGVLIVIGVIVCSSLIFQDNLFSELSWTARCLLIALAIGVMFTNKKEDVPSPIELQFYDDYLILYRLKKYYNKKVSRLEFNKMFYKDITKCVYRKDLQRLHIYGTVSAKWFNYNKDGSIPKQPTYNRIVENTICYARTLFATDVDFKKEIEEHSPIEVKIEE